MAFYSKYKSLLTIIFALSVAIVVLFIVRRNIDQRPIVKEPVRYIMQYHKNDMEELKTKASGKERALLSLKNIVSFSHLSKNSRLVNLS